LIKQGHKIGILKLVDLQKSWKKQKVLADEPRF